MDSIVNSRYLSTSPLAVKEHSLFHEICCPTMPDLPHCPATLSDELHEPLRQLANAWANCDSRPKVSAEVEAQWTAMLEAWIADDTLPLFIRKPSSSRGKLLAHSTGRRLIPADNSPAQWAFSMALQGNCPTMDEIHQLIESDRIPIAMILKTVEREQASYRCPLGKAENLNMVGWKLAHIESIGLRQRGELEDTAMERLETHFLRFMDPNNMFLVPKAWAGLGEMPEMIDAVRAYRVAVNGD